MRQFITIFSLICATALSAMAQDHYGSYQGELDVQGSKLTLVVHLFVDQNTQEPVCVMDSPDQGAKGIETKIDELSQTRLKFSIPMLQASYDGTFVGDAIHGTFTQMGYAFPLNFAKTVIKAPKRPQMPVEPYPYKTEEVTFTNPNDGAMLKGTLSYPTNFQVQKVAKTPILIMVTGSGLQDRDESLFGHKPFLVIADHLARHGVATLRYDDRGAGESTGEVKSATTATFKEDAEAAVHLLRDRGFKKVGIIGHSEGGTIAFLMAGGQKVDFVVSMAGTTVSGMEIINSQVAVNIDGTKALTDEQKTDYKTLFRRAYDVVLKADKLEEVKSIIDKEYATLTSDERQSLQAKSTELFNNLTPWFRYFMTLDPRPAIEKIKVPVMAINGTKDLQVDCTMNLGALRKHLKANKRHMIKSYDGLNHLFQPCDKGLVGEYEKIETTIASEVLNDISNWIKQLP